MRAALLYLSSLSILALLLAPACPGAAQTTTVFPGKIGSHPPSYGSAALLSPRVELTYNNLKKITVEDTARPWTLTVADTAPLRDESGFPLEDFQVLFFDHRPTNAWANGNTGPTDDPRQHVVDLTGTYILTFKGRARISSWCDNPGFAVENPTYDSLTNTTRAELLWPEGAGETGPYGFMLLNFYGTQAEAGAALGSGVTDIRLIRPGYPEYTVQPFRTEILNALRPFRVLRYMTFTNTNSHGPASYLDPGPAYPDGPVTEWAGRQLPEQYPYRLGAPWEAVADLTNMTEASPWICVPHAATDDYVRNLARLLRDSIRPDVHIYLEYSNEVWNPDFPQYHYNREFTDHAPEAADIRAGATPGETYFTTIAQPRRYAERLIQIAQIFEEEFGVELAARTKLRPVFCWQTGSDYGRERYLDVLEWIDAKYGPPADYLYAIGSTGYFGDFDEDGRRAQGSPAEVVEVMRQNSDANVPDLAELSGYAKAFGIKHVQYEGGPANGGPRDNLDNLANRIEANRHPDMRDLVIRNYARNFFDTTVVQDAEVNELANYFVLLGKPSRYGCWGSLEDAAHIDDAERAPKYDALKELTGMDADGFPTCELLELADGDTLNAAQPNRLRAEVSDATEVAFFDGARQIGVDTEPPFSLDWTLPADGRPHALSARARNASGFYTFSETAEVFARRLAWAEDSVVFTPLGDPLAANVISDAAWQILEAPEWVSLSEEAGDTSAALELTAEIWDETEPREGIVVLASGALRDTLRVLQDHPVSRNEAKGGAPRLVVSPNPARGSATLTYDLPPGQAYRLVLRDATGRVVRVVPLDGATGAHTLDLDGLPAGVWFCTAENAAGVVGVVKVAVGR